MRLRFLTTRRFCDVSACRCPRGLASGIPKCPVPFVALIVLTSVLYRSPSLFAFVEPLVAQSRHKLFRRNRNRRWMLGKARTVIALLGRCPQKPTSREQRGLHAARSNDWDREASAKMMCGQFARSSSRRLGKLEAMKQKADVNHLSPPDVKIALFRSLFRGRDDVYPAALRAARPAKLDIRRCAPTSGSEGFAKSLASNALIVLISGFCPLPTT